MTDGIYEYIHPKPDVLKDNPLKSDEIMQIANQAGFNPMVVRVDNTLGQIFFYFDKPLNKKQKEALDSLVYTIFKSK